MVTLKYDKLNRLIAEPVPVGLSAAITTIAKAEGFVEIIENKQFIELGEEVEVYLF